MATTGITAGNGGGDEMAKTTSLVKVDEVAVERVNALLPAANDGNRQALGELRGILDDHPDLWSAVGDLAATAELTLVNALSGDNTVHRDAVLRKLASLRREVSGPVPTSLERLLVDRVVVGWLGVAFAEGTYHRAIEQGQNQEDDEFHHRRVERAQRRYLTAIKALATVRRLGVPALQVNIGDKQVNIGDKQVNVAG